MQNNLPNNIDNQFSDIENNDDGHSNDILNETADLSNTPTVSVDCISQQRMPSFSKFLLELREIKGVNIVTSQLLVPIEK